ncbi:MAG: nucleotidyltransferase domain-containing protein, partial [Bacteroidota bacterium]
MTIEEIKKKQLLLVEVVSGSHAYGLNHAQSDRDLRGVFVLPQSDFYGLNYVEQVSDAKNDEVYYELRKFVNLLAQNNPNFLEILATPSEHILYQHPLFKRFRLQDFICRKALQSFTGYAQTQVRRARGLNKKIVNPVEKERKSVLDFCYVQRGQGSIPVLEFLAVRALQQSACGLSKIPHMKDCYGLYHGSPAAYKGIVSSLSANDVLLSSIEKEAEPIALMYFNREAYSVYCKDHRQYWEWVEKRNEHRYQSTMQHGKQYDAKNMMHTFRLLHMAKEMAETGSFALRRTVDREFLLNIREGKFEYEYLVAQAEAIVAEVQRLSRLPDLPLRKAV